MLSKLLSLILIFSSLGMDAVCRYENQLSLGGNLFLVNRDYRISADYVPNDLVMPQVKRTSDSVLLRPEAADALERLFQAAKEEAGYSLVAVSGFRSYQTQSLIFNRRLKSVGRQKTMLFVALPGASEHQLGLAMDVARQKNTSLNASFGSSPEGIWLAENCYRFGFILRYQEQWTEITGYAYEPWHIRYVGEEHALRIQELDIPLEEYISALRTTIDLFSTENE
ncbi:MAG: M15 family metallopeptidase [Clostridia bacterium]|nr:M15 family metallopeptidase [Clostridia bacterium]